MCTHGHCCFSEISQLLILQYQCSLTIENKTITCVTLNQVFDIEFETRGEKNGQFDKTTFSVAKSPKNIQGSIVCYTLLGTNLLSKNEDLSRGTFRGVGKYISYLYSCQGRELSQEGYANLHILRQESSYRLVSYFQLPFQYPNKYLRQVRERSAEYVGVLSTFQYCKY